MFACVCACVCVCMWVCARARVCGCLCASACSTGAGGRRTHQRVRMKEVVHGGRDPDLARRSAHNIRQQLLARAHASTRACVHTHARVCAHIWVLHACTQQTNTQLLRICVHTRLRMRRQHTRVDKRATSDVQMRAHMLATHACTHTHTHTVHTDSVPYTNTHTHIHTARHTHTHSGHRQRAIHTHTYIHAARHTHTDSAPFTHSGPRTRAHTNTHHTHTHTHTARTTPSH